MISAASDWTLSPPAGGRGVQHRERPPGPNSEAEDYGVLREEGEADRAAEENVSHGFGVSGHMSSCQVI